MIRYSLLYKDDTSKISYFYNLDDNNVYVDKTNINLKIIKRFSILGSSIGFLLYILINIFNIKDINISTIAVLIVLLTGIIIGWTTSIFIIKNTTKFFTDNNKLEITKEGIKQMYNKNQGFRKKYKLLLSYLIIFTIICTFVLISISTNLIELICIMILWCILSLLFFLNRPVCSNKLKKICT